MKPILPEFRKFIAGRKPAHHIPFSNGLQSTPTDLKIQFFLGDLKRKTKLQDWQVAQGCYTQNINPVLLKLIRSCGGL